MNEKLRQLIADETGIALSDIKLSTSIASLGVDSLEFVNLMLAASNAFGKDIQQERYPYINTVGDLAEELGC